MERVRRPPAITGESDRSAPVGSLRFHAANSSRPGTRLLRDTYDQLTEPESHCHGHRRVALVHAAVTVHPPLQRRTGASPKGSLTHLPLCGCHSFSGVHDATARWTISCADRVGVAVGLAENLSPGFSRGRCARPNNLWPAWVPNAPLQLGVGACGCRKPRPRRPPGLFLRSLGKRRLPMALSFLLWPSSGYSRCSGFAGATGTTWRSRSSCSVTNWRFSAGTSRVRHCGP